MLVKGEHNSLQTSVVVVGGGQAGLEAAAALRSQKFAGGITLVSEEPYAPYQRPPLSKDFLLGEHEVDRLTFREPSYFEKQQIALLLNAKVIRIGRSERKVYLQDGRSIPYDYLILAVGARNRPLPIKGAEQAFYLRSLDEAIALRKRIANAKNVAVIGGGFIGLEVAAAARHYGNSVTVIETLPRLMARAVPSLLSDFFLELHRRNGVEIRMPAAAAEIDKSGVTLTDGMHVAADVVVAGIGVIPETKLAAEAGLAVGNGIAVDEFLRTSDPRIFAIGDCAEHPSVYSCSDAGNRVRLESVQNAADQAKFVARGLAMTNARPASIVPYRDVPWFWTNQFDVRFQMAGLSAGHDAQVMRGSISDAKFSVFYFKAGKMIAVDSINRLADHMAARKLLATGTPLTPEQAADETVDLRKL
jgi:3-phenylpropionate/trans-cinnamate dioxygenase ferredoxin reductase subunit